MQTVLIAIALLVLLWVFLNRKYPTFPDRLSRFWSKPKHPTKHGIAKKYPKSKSLQQQSLDRKHREAREKERLEAERKQAIIDRHIKELRASEKKKNVSNAELKLSTYLFFDREKTARLVDGVQARNPDKSREWCAERALADLERDRQMR